MPSLPWLTAAALVLSVIFQYSLWHFVQMPQHTYELLRLDAVLLRHVSLGVTGLLWLLVGPLGAGKTTSAVTSFS